MTQVLNQFRLDGKVVIITGGAGLLGIKHAEAVAEAGGLPVVVDINPMALKKAKELLSAYKVSTHVCDVTNKDSISGLQQEIVERLGKVDVLINNAAINPKVEDGLGQYETSRLEHYVQQAYEKELSVGLTSAFLCTQIFGTHMAKNGGGVILNIASDLGLIAPNQELYQKEGLEPDQQPVKPVTYSVIKHGLIGLTRYTATYWAKQGVRCNALAPGGVENGQDEIFMSKIQKLIPIGRMAHQNEYKAAVVFMISEASSYMNGAVLSIDGGRTCW